MKKEEWWWIIQGKGSETSTIMPLVNGRHEGPQQVRVYILKSEVILPGVLLPDRRWSLSPAHQHSLRCLPNSTCVCEIMEIRRDPSTLPPSVRPSSSTSSSCRRTSLSTRFRRMISATGDLYGENSFIQRTLTYYVRLGFIQPFDKCPTFCFFQISTTCVYFLFASRPWLYNKVITLIHLECTQQTNQIKCKISGL